MSSSINSTHHGHASDANTEAIIPPHMPEEVLDEELVAEAYQSQNYASSSNAATVTASRINLNEAAPLTSSGGSGSGEIMRSPTAVSPSLYRQQWLAFFMLGTINNLSYVVVNSAAKSIVDYFNQGALIGAVVWANVGLGVAIRVLNVYLLHTSVSLRMKINLILCLLGCVGVAIGSTVSLWLCLAAVVSIGCFSSLGESVLLAYLKDFNPLLMGAWSSGTGLAGVAGTLMYLLMFSLAGWSNMTVFLLQLPFVAVYWLAFLFVDRTRPAVPATLSDDGDGTDTNVDASIQSRTSADATSIQRTQTGEPLDSAGAKLTQTPSGLSASPLSLQQRADGDRVFNRSPAIQLAHNNLNTTNDGNSSIVADDSSFQNTNTPVLGNKTLRGRFFATSSSPSASGSLSSSVVTGARMSPTDNARERLLDNDHFGDSDAAAAKQASVRRLLVSEGTSTDDVDKPSSSRASPNEQSNDRLLQSSSSSSDGAALTSTAPANETSWQRFCRVWRIVASPTIQLASVYLFEYVVSVGFASVANPLSDEEKADNSASWWKKNAYEILSFCYQVGVLIARSSVSVLQVERIEILTLLQGAQFVLWFIHATHLFMPLWLQFADMAFVGLLGGCMYVNVFYRLVRDKTLKGADQELGINIVALGINGGIVLSACLEIILMQTILHAST